MGRQQALALENAFPHVVVEPVLKRLKAGDDRMPVAFGMLARVLARRTVAASDIPALRTSTKLKPPPLCGGTLHTTVRYRLYGGVDTLPDRIHGHPPVRECRHLVCGTLLGNCLPPRLTDMYLPPLIPSLRVPGDAEKPLYTVSSIPLKRGVHNSGGEP